MSILEPEIEHWNHDLEIVVKRDGEQCQSLFWMHNEASSWALTRNDGIQIPAIILASATGFLSATSTLIPPIAIGAMSLSVGILNTVNSYFKFSQQSEAHRVTAQLYMKAYKIIETELALPVHQRQHALRILADLRDTMQRISEIAPPLPSAVITKYNKIFKTSTVTKPIVANGLSQITICTTNNYEDNIVDEKEVITVNIPSVNSSPVDISSNTIKWPSVKSSK